MKARLIVNQKPKPNAAPLYVSLAVTFSNLNRARCLFTPTEIRRALLRATRNPEDVCHPRNFRICLLFVLCLLPGCAKKSEPVAPFNATLPKTVSEPLPPPAPVPDTKSVFDAAKSIREKSERANAVAKTTLAAVAASSNPGASALKSPLAEVVDLTTSISATATALEGQIAPELRDQVKASEAAHVAREAAAGRNLSASETNAKAFAEKCEKAVAERDEEISEANAVITKLQAEADNKVRNWLLIFSGLFFLAGILSGAAFFFLSFAGGLKLAPMLLFVGGACLAVAEYLQTIEWIVIVMLCGAALAAMVYGIVYLWHHRTPDKPKAPDIVEIPKP